MDRPIRSECIITLANALKELHKKLKHVPKDMCSDQYTKGKYNYRYASLQSIIDTARPLLGEFGLEIIHFTETETLVAVLTHIQSNQYIESRYKLIYRAEDPRAYSAAITFGMKDTYRMLLGMVADDDTDGHLAD